MDTPHKLPGDRIDTLASQLKGSLKRGRPRPWLMVVAAMIAAMALLALLAWWLYHPSEAPRLEVIAFDAVVAPDEAPQLVAQLAFPEPGDFARSMLARRAMVFLDLQAALNPGQQGHEAKTTTDAQGRAVVDWPAPLPGKAATIIVRYVDVRNKQGSQDQATLYTWDRDSKILLVDVEETLYAPGQPNRPQPNQAPPPPQAIAALHEAHRRGYRIAYLAVAGADPLDYRTARGWVTAPRAAKDSVPAGPVLGRREYPSSVEAVQARRDRVSDLKQRLGSNITFVTRTAFAATAATGNQLRAIVIEPGDNVPGAVRVCGWSEVAAQLGKE